MAVTLIENFRAVFYTPFYAAFALRAYEAEGLEVHRIMSTEPTQTMQLLLSGKGDVAWGGPIRLLRANNETANPGLVIFCDVVGRDPFFLVGREPNPTFQLHDLLGKRVATRGLDLVGEAGSLEKCPLARGFRDVRVMSIFAGTNEIMKGIAAKFMGL